MHFVRKISPVKPADDFATVVEPAVFAG